jgi:hypothetical protein
LPGSGAKRDVLVRYRDRLEADIRIFDPKDAPAARKRYVALLRAPKGQSTRFVLRALREASGPLTSRDLADMGRQERGLTVKDSTVSMLRKGIEAILRALEHKGADRQERLVEGGIGWR